MTPVSQRPKPRQGERRSRRGQATKVVQRLVRERIHELFQTWGARGGKRRAQALSPERRREIARAGAQARRQGLTGTQRRTIARKAAEARWRRTNGPRG